MARCPFARWKPIPPQTESSYKYDKSQLILHSADGSYVGSLAHWKKRWQWRVYSTFFVLNDGTLIQLIDSAHRTSANRSANTHSIAVETEDHSEPDHLLWTPPQMETLVKLARWCHDEHGIPLQPCSSANEPGVAVHTMWGPSGKTNPWIGARITKTCPGLARIQQFYRELLPALGHPTTAKDLERFWDNWPRTPKITVWSKPPPKKRRKRRRKGRVKPRRRKSRYRSSLLERDPTFERLRQDTTEGFFRRRNDA